MNIASMSNPPMNWGYARTVEGFIHTWARGQYEMIHPTGSFATLVDQIGMYLEIVTRQFGVIYIMLALVPLWFLRRLPARERSWLKGLFASYVACVLLLLAVLNISLDQASIDIFWKVLVTPTYVILSLLTGYGLTLLLFRLAPAHAPSGTPEISGASGS